MKISFDYDGVLSTPQGKKLAKRKIAEGDRVYVVTARGESQRVLDVAKEVGIPRLQVYFTDGKDKWKTIKRLGIERHYDNNQEQIDKIKENTEANATLLKYD
jgi:D-arabinose 1-dehydrogenase-like Zn-dependent alcohol dehydrogenase